MDKTKLSKKLSYHLRHHPEDLNLELTDQAFTTATISEIAQRIGVTEEEIREVVRQDPKSRFTIKNNRIRANYGHSIAIGKTMFDDDDVIPLSELPDILFHGTKQRVMDKILKEGLQPQQRQFVHLSYTTEVARQVGNRREGKTIILEIDTKKAYSHGIEFYDGGQSTILASHIPPSYLNPRK